MKAIFKNNSWVLTISGICMIISGVLMKQYEMRRQIEAQRAIIHTEEEIEQDRDWGVRRRTTSRDTLPDGKTIRVTIETTSNGQTLKKTHDYAL
jgi:hypothetical protein